MIRCGQSCPAAGILSLVSLSKATLTCPPPPLHSARGKGKEAPVGEVEGGSGDGRD